MCQLRKDNRLQKPKTETFIAYKVFECHGGTPWNFTGIAQFKFGNNVWYEDKAGAEGFADQKGL